MLSIANIETTRLKLTSLSALDGAQVLTAESLGELQQMLTLAITQYLPMSMQFDAQMDNIGSWVHTVLSEATVCGVTKKDGVLVGLILLHGTDDLPDIHLGYFFGEAFWGRGYATEALMGLIARAFGNSNKRLVAGVDHENRGSVRVLEKLGFTALDAGERSSQRMYERLLGV